MNRIFKLVAPLLALVTAGVLPAVSKTAPAMPVIAIQQVDAEDPTVYTTLIAGIDARIKEKFGIENFSRIYIGLSAGDHTGVVFAVRAADSFVTLDKQWQAVLNDPELAGLRTQMNSVRKLGSNTSWKALRFGGTHKGGWLYNAWVKVSDEPGYLKALDELRAGLDRLGFNDMNMNVYRAAAGLTDSTHFVSFNGPSSERLAAFLDAVATETWIREWMAASAKYRTLVRTGTYREITQ